MPLIPKTQYPGPPFWQFNGHVQTLFPSLYRKAVSQPEYTRERIDTPDDDFLDLDWLVGDSKKLAILTHGLEGNSQRPYILNTARLYHDNNWDVLAWNCRSCSGEMNRAFRMYHHGDIEDIGTVIQHALSKNKYKEVVLVGFSMGGNIIMKYLGVHGKNLPSEISKAVAFSAPVHLESASAKLERWDNILYKKKFFRSLSQKVIAKEKQYPGSLPVEKISEVKRWRDFDEWFSAPISGYPDANAFYQDSSPINFIEGIRIPCLLVNSWNDPILSPKCMPIELAENNPDFYLEMPKNGGHCGFMLPNSGHSWSEIRALEFCEE